MKRFVQAFFWGLALSAHAATNPPAWSDFRVVESQPYNITRSVRWQPVRLMFIRATNGLLIGYKIETVGEYANIRGSAERQADWQSAGGYMAGAERTGGNGWHKVKVGATDIPGAMIAVRNYTGPALASSQEIAVRALRVGVTNLDDVAMELWDLGTPYRPAAATNPAPRRVGGGTNMPVEVPVKIPPPLPPTATKTGVKQEKRVQTADDPKPINGAKTLNPASKASLAQR